MNDDQLCQMYDNLDYGNPLTIQTALMDKHKELKKELDRIIQEINMITRAISYIRSKHFKDVE